HLRARPVLQMQGSGLSPPSARRRLRPLFRTRLNASTPMLWTEQAPEVSASPTSQIPSRSMVAPFPVTSFRYESKQDCTPPLVHWDMTWLIGAAQGTLDFSEIMSKRVQRWPLLGVDS